MTCEAFNSKSEFQLVVHIQASFSTMSMNAREHVEGSQDVPFTLMTPGGKVQGLKAQNPIT